MFFGLIDLYIDPHNVYQPDLIYISKDRSEIITHRAIEGVPDLVVEIISRPTEAFDRTKKLKKYLEFGVPEIWVVDPENNSLEVYGADQIEKGATKYFFCSGVVTSPSIVNLSFDLESIF